MIMLLVTYASSQGRVSVQGTYPPVVYVINACGVWLRWVWLWECVVFYITR